VPAKGVKTLKQEKKLVCVHQELPISKVHQVLS
jgi:hypothetical protein